jgi:hypothetical protein
LYLRHVLYYSRCIPFRFWWWYCREHVCFITAFCSPTDIV